MMAGQPFERGAGAQETVAPQNTQQQVTNLPEYHQNQQANLPAYHSHQQVTNSLGHYDHQHLAFGIPNPPQHVNIAFHYQHQQFTSLNNSIPYPTSQPFYDYQQPAHGSAYQPQLVYYAMPPHPAFTSDPAPATPQPLGDNELGEEDSQEYLNTYMPKLKRELEKKRHKEDEKATRSRVRKSRSRPTRTPQPGTNRVTETRMPTPIVSNASHLQEAASAEPQMSPSSVLPLGQQYAPDSPAVAYFAVSNTSTFQAAAEAQASSSSVADKSQQYAPDAPSVAFFAGTIPQEADTEASGGIEAASPDPKDLDKEYQLWEEGWNLICSWASTMRNAGEDPEWNMDYMAHKSRLEGGWCYQFWKVDEEFKT